ncbi:DUF1868 domain-containing protein [Ruegeria sp. 2205SS24-7]|uniref:DUF1868 domain-containing protein n=1 Tax=Ruegeria discodermiae TaxID=3064389 RepID=UPI0027426DD0|nr:DUF1868 domain-containing protein [Ruegeria sp. 2205SS24-7]MDP5219321.1 DUF1868 domain-containing protein [Ruegeria sp. 2205SS24-7]
MSPKSLCPDDRSGPRPAWSVEKFDDAGQVRATPGLTTLCHIDQRSTAYAALCRVASGLRAGPHAHAFAFLPPESFHMTVFDGVIDYRRDGANWPSDMAADASIDQIAANWHTRLQGVHLPQQFEISVEAAVGGYTCPATGADAAQERQLRACRNQLADCLGVRRDNHDSYGFHITLAYQVQWLDLQSAQDVLALSDQLFAENGADLQNIQIGPVEFCRFENMLHFEPLLML